MRRIGIDVGGTNTDAVLLEDGRVVHAVKTPTTADVTGGIVAALDRARPRIPRWRAAQIDAVVIGTTHFINAVVQRRGLVAGRRDPHRHAGRAPRCRRSATGRRTSPSWCAARSSCSKAGTITTAARSCRSTTTACARRRARSAHSGLAVGGDRLDLLAARPVATRSGRGDILAEECPEAAVTLSHELGRIGLLERENAALLNAALADLARDTIAGFRDGDRRQRHRRAALPDPERRHGDVGRDGDGACRS